MAEQHDLSDAAAFLRQFKRWTGAVYHYARARKLKPRVSAEDYLLLHADLLQRCRVLAAESDDPEKCDAYNKLAEMMGPWLTRETLNGARKQILLDLFGRSAILQDVIDEHAARRQALMRAGVIAAVLMVACVAFLLFEHSGADSGSIELLLNRGRRFFRGLASSARGSSFLERFSMVTGVIVVVGILMITKATRRWS